MNINSSKVLKQSNSFGYWTVFIIFKYLLLEYLAIQKKEFIHESLQPHLYNLLNHKMYILECETLGDNY